MDNTITPIRYGSTRHISTGNNNRPNIFKSLYNANRPYNAMPKGAAKLPIMKRIGNALFNLGCNVAQKCIKLFRP